MNKLDDLRSLVRNYNGPITESPHYQEYAQLLVRNDILQTKDLLTMVLEAGALVDKLEQTPRNHMEVLSALGEEYGELSTEVRIATGVSYKEPGKDGVFGEAVDNMLVSIDMIYVDNPEVTVQQITNYAALKLAKWQTKVAKG